MSDHGTAQPDPLLVRFHYIKNQAFRTLHVDGVLGGVTPRGLIHVAVYSERIAIPQMTEHQILPTGQLSPAPVSVEGKAGVVRELDADLVMTREVAIDLRNWLDARLSELDTLLVDPKGSV